MESAILKQNRMDGERTEKNTLIGKEIKIADYMIMDSKFDNSQWAIVQAEDDGKQITFSANSFQLKQLKQVESDKFPLKVKIATKPSETGKEFIRFERVDGK